MRIHTSVKEKGGYFEHKLCYMSLYFMCSEKNPLTVSFISQQMLCRFKQKWQSLYVRNVDSDNVEIKYSLRPKT